MSGFLAGKTTLVTGADGFPGAAVMAAAREMPRARVVGLDRSACDLTDPRAVAETLAAIRPEVVVHVDEEGGGIQAHRRYPGRHFYANAAMALNLVEQSRIVGVKRFVYVGTADSYPGAAPVPMNEDDLWTGLPDSSHASYGIARRMAATLLEAYSAEYGMAGAYLVLTNVYGPGSDFDPEGAQVVAAMIRRFVAAAGDGVEEVTCWGSGAPTRDFLYVDDAARAIVLAADVHDSGAPLNIGSGREVSIREIAERVAAAAGYRGRIEWDTSRPDGVMRRSLDVARASAAIGFEPRISLEQGLASTVSWWNTRIDRLG